MSTDIDDYERNTDSKPRRPQPRGLDMFELLHQFQEELAYDEVDPVQTLLSLSELLNELQETLDNMSHVISEATACIKTNAN